MEKIVGYTVVRGTDYARFVEAVKQFIVDGSQPFGSLSTTTVYVNEHGTLDKNGHPAVQYSQAMVVYEKK
jgi:hypothetical protein